MALYLPIFLDHSHNGPFQILMFITLFLLQVIDQAIINLSSGLRLLVPSWIMIIRVHKWNQKINNVLLLNLYICLNIFLNANINESKMFF